MNKIPFKVSARAARLIGRENVSNADGALIELIKNSYDAGASICFLIFDFSGELEDEGSIYIIDNGSGMSQEVLEDYWMTIGTNNKELNYIGENGRVKSGAKGIGRFALDRLGGRAEVITKTNYVEKTLQWNVNWNDFDAEGIALENVYASVENQGSSFFLENIEKVLKRKENREILDKHSFNKGTIIKIKELRDDWSDYFVEKLNNNLGFLVPVIEESDFEIFLSSTSKPNKYGIINSLLNYDYDYKLNAKVFSDGVVKLVINRNEFDLNNIDQDLFDLEEMRLSPYTYEDFKSGIIEKITTVKALLPNYETTYNQNVFEQLGSFEFTMYFIKRSYTKKDKNKFFYRYFDSASRDAWMESFAGIKIYRDNFRVRPYGEMAGSSFDWLMLGERASKSPAAASHRSGSWRVRPNQISGSIYISRIVNGGLEDKSSREGFQENIIFKTMRDLIIKIVQVFESDRQYIMRALDKLYDMKNLDEQQKKQANQIANQIVSKIDNKINSEELEVFMRKDAKSIEKVEILAKSYLAQLKTNKDLIGELQLLRALASTGLTLTAFAHDLKNLSANIIPRNDNLRTVILRLVNENELKHLPEFLNPLIVINDMQKQDKRLREWLEFSLTTIKVDKRTRKQIEVFKYFEEFKKTWKSVLDFQNVTLNVPHPVVEAQKCILRIFEIDFDSIFNNLISNSLTAFKREDASDERLINIEIQQINSEIIITFADSGPGLSKDIENPNSIFEAFFTTKRDEAGEETGTGLGMWIIKSTVEEYKGEAKIKKAQSGFSIQLSFVARKNEGMIIRDIQK